MLYVRGLPSELAAVITCYVFNSLQCVSGIHNSLSPSQSSLRQVLEDAYAVSEKRTTKSIANMQFSRLAWGTEHGKASVRFMRL